MLENGNVPTGTVSTGKDPEALSQLKVERIYTKQKTRFAREFSIQFVTTKFL